MAHKELREIACFGFTADEVCKDASEMMENVVKNTIKDLEELLISKSKDVPPETINKEMFELHKLVMEKAKEPMEKFKEVARNIFTVPPDVQVPGFDEEDEAVTDDQLEALKKEVGELEDSLLQKYKETSKLEIEAAKFKQVKPIYEQCKINLEALQKYNSEEGEIQEQFAVLKKCEYNLLHGQSSGSDLVQQPLTDKYNMFKKKDQ